MHTSKVEASHDIRDAGIGRVRNKISRDEKRSNEVAICDKFEEVKMHVGKLLKHGRYAVEDGIIEALHTMKRRPIGFFAIAFFCGATLGFMLRNHPRK